MSARLSAEQRRSYREHGYLHVRGAAPEPFLLEVQVDLERVVDEHIAGWRDAGLIDDDFAHLGFTTRLHAAWRAGGRPPDVAVRPIGPALGGGFGGKVPGRWLASLTADVAGRVDPTPLEHSYVRAKFPDDASTTTPWHQDSQCLGEVLGSGFVTAWLPLVDVDRRNACLEVAAVPRGRETLAPVQSQRTAYVCMAPADVSRLTDVRTIEMRRGDVLLLGPHTPHRTIEPASGETRWSVDVRYATAVDAASGQDARWAAAGERGQARRARARGGPAADHQVSIAGS